MKRLVILCTIAMIATPCFAQWRSPEYLYLSGRAYGGGTAGNIPGTANDLGMPSGIGGPQFDNFGGWAIRPHQHHSDVGSSGVPTWWNNAAPIGSTGNN